MNNGSCFLWMQAISLLWIFQALNISIIMENMFWINYYDLIWDSAFEISCLIDVRTLEDVFYQDDIHQSLEFILWLNFPFLIATNFESGLNVTRNSNSIRNTLLESSTILSSSEWYVESKFDMFNKLEWNGMNPTYIWTETDMVNTYVHTYICICKVTQMPSHHQLTCIYMDMNGLRFWIKEEIYNICSSNSRSFLDEMKLDSLEMNLEWKFREKLKPWQYFYLFTELNYGKFFKKLFHSHFQLHLKWKILYKTNIYIYVVQWDSYGFGFRFRFEPMGRSFHPTNER